MNSLLLADEQLSGKMLASNAIILCRPKHPFIKFVINKLAVQDYVKRPGQSQVFQFNDLVQRYITYTQSLKVPRKEDSIFLAPPDLFLPMWDNRITDQLRNTCDRILKIGKYRSKKLQLKLGICYGLIQNNFANSPTAGSYTKHHWLDSNMLAETTDTVDVVNIVPNGTLVLFPNAA